jgi:hypothetical protein
MLKVKDTTIVDYLENAYANLVQAAKIAHLEHHSDAESISKLIDDLEKLFESFLKD